MYSAHKRNHCIKMNIILQSWKRQTAKTLLLEMLMGNIFALNYSMKSNNMASDNC